MGLPVASSPNMFISISETINFQNSDFNRNQKFMEFYFIHFELSVMQTKGACACGLLKRGQPNSIILNRRKNMRQNNKLKAF